eukprot:TRINITY_DN1416_c0_g1_i1.p1 TRINITY_DN1416_c0_g1~~TRINITY_DN1416_c0_g1_i1.p1  ORF type:complete len:609 (+),score=166.49 TRINITY_DN1416_c0_g1_i1:130-1956(+)
MEDRKIFPVDMEAYFREPVDSEFSDYPEPPERPRSLFTESELDKQKLDYMKQLNVFVDEISQHVRSLQSEEHKKMQSFNQKLKEQSSKDTSAKKKPEDKDDFKEFQGAISSLRKNRKAYKEMIREALNERQKFLDSYKLQTEKGQEVEAMLRRLKLSDKPTSARSHGRELNSFFGVMIALQVAFFLIAFAIFSYRDDPAENNGTPLRADDHFSYFIHICLMVVFGFGYLTVYLRKYGFGAVCFNFLVAAFCFQWGLANITLWKNIKETSTGFFRLNLTIEILIQVAYLAGAVVISLGSFCGKLTAVEMILIAFWEVIFYSLNHYVVIMQLGVVDPGGSIYIHMFGAFFALGASYLLSKEYSEVLGKKQKARKLTASWYLGDFFTLIGTLVIWCLFPSWNAPFAPDGTQYRVIINTLLSLCSSSATALFASRTFRGRNYHVRDIQHATIAGGVAMASAHSAIILPGAALMVGAVAGAVAVVGFVFIQKWLESSSPLKVFDTRGAFVLHGISGLIGGIAGVIACGGTSSEMLYGQDPAKIFPHGLPDQGGYQAAGIFITIAIAFLSGLVGSFWIWLLRKNVPHHTLGTIFADRREFHVPSGYPEFEFQEP